MKIAIIQVTALDATILALGNYADVLPNYHVSLSREIRVSHSKRCPENLDDLTERSVLSYFTSKIKEKKTIAGMIASIAGTLKLQALQQKIIKPSDLDTTLLAAAQAGVYLYCLFGVVGDTLTMGPTWVLSLITDLLALMQSTSQTLLIKVRN